MASIFVFVLMGVVSWLDIGILFLFLPSPELGGCFSFYLIFQGYLLGWG